MSHIERIEKFFAGVGTALQMLGAVVLLIVLGHYAIGAAAFMVNLVATGESGKVDARYAAPVYDSWPDRIAYWTEFNNAWGEHFEPYFHWRRNAFSGTYINVDDEGVRVTPKPEAAKGGKKVFMFGGSTMWGTGAPDDKTIPALLQALLGPGYDVYNYGETAYVSTQELNYLLYQLARGHVPDIVIFYDGVNDGYAGAYSPAIPRDPHNLRLRNAEDRNLFLEVFEKSNYKRLSDFIGRLIRRLSRPSDPSRRHQDWDAQIAPAIARNSQGVVDTYEANIKQIKALAREYGFEAYFFWQPNLFSLTRTTLNAYEQDVIDASSQVLIESQRQVYEAAKRRFSNREGEHIYFLGNLFDHVDEPIYIDWHHVGPNGNARLARAMYDAIRPSLTATGGE